MKNALLLVAGLLLAFGTVVAQPVISSLSSNTAIPGSSLTINGSGFNTTAANNVVYFGGVKANVSSATSTALVVGVPNGAAHAPVNVNNLSTHLIGYSPYPFLPTFNYSGYVAGTVNAADKVEFNTGAHAIDVALGDIDGDGKIDMITAAIFSNGYSVYRNISSSGTISSSSFSSPVTFSAGTTTAAVALGDMDGDGKLDVIVANAGSNFISVFRNTATSGTISGSSFATKVNFTTGSDPESIGIGDIDKDGKPDIAVGNFNSNTISVFRNTSSSGSITTSSFASKVDFTSSAHPRCVTFADIDGDSKLDMVVANTTVSVFRNTSTSGSITTSSFASKVDYSLTSGSAKRVVVTDIDGDGKGDILASNQSYSLAIFRNVATSGSITSSSLASVVNVNVGWLSYAIATGDLNGDSKPDVIVGATDGIHDSLCVLVNTASAGSITSSSLAKTGSMYAGGSAVSVADIDGDGKPDIASVYEGACTGCSRAYVMRNDPLLPITGIFSVCNGGATTTLSDATIGGWWSSSDTSVAMVTSNTGIVTGLVAGTAIISYNRPFGTATVVVTVNPPVYPNVGADFVCAGASSTITNGTSGGTWTTSNPAIASIASSTGVLTANIVGHVNITYTPPTGCKAISSATIDTLPYAITASGEPCAGTSVRLYDAMPGGAWSSSNDTIATVDTAGMITGIVAGSVTVSYTVSNSCGTNSATKLITVKPDFGVPVIASLSSLTGIPGNIVTISGSNFSDITGGNTVTFGATKGSVISATGISLTVSVPYGATFQQVSVNNGCGLTGYSSYPFLPVFNNSGYLPGTVNFGPHADLPSTGMGIFDHVIIADVDADGKPDVIAGTPGWGFSIYHNAAPTGKLDSAALGERVDFSFPDYWGNSSLRVTDVDGDAKPDIVLAVGGYISVMTNASVPGTINHSSFASPVTSEMGSIFDIADMDSDGKPDIAFVGASGLSVMKNISSIGTIAFAMSELISSDVTGDYYTKITLGDLNGDNKPEIIFCGSSSTYIFENASTTSGLAFTTPVALSGMLKAVVADVDSDNVADIIGNTSSAVLVYKNNTSSGTLSAASFSEAVSYLVSALAPGQSDFAIGDINGDSRPDVVIAGGNDDVSSSSNGRLSVMLNVASAGTIDTNSFSKLIPFSINGGISGLVRVAVGDLDADGKPDVAISEWGLSVLKNIPLVPSPSITAVSPVKSAPGTTVAISGTNFSSTADSNTVYFGATKAVVNTATSSSLNVTVPSEATYEYVTVNNKQVSLTGYAPYAFLPTFDTAGFIHGVSNFTFGTMLPHWGASYTSIALGDMDNDGKSDLVVALGGSSTVVVHKNLSTTGVISDSSFAPGVSFSMPSPGYNLYVRTADIDGDGKLDIITGDGNALYIHHNVTTTGVISSASFSDAVTINDVTKPFSLVDLDKDGKVDIVGTRPYSYLVAVLRNTSIKGKISTGSFACPITMSLPPLDGIGGLETADIDGDGKHDIIASVYSSSVGNHTAVIRNATAPGIINNFSFEPPVYFDMLGQNFKVADVDGDGKNDIIGRRSTSISYAFSVLRNTATPAIINDSSFAAIVDCPVPDGFGGEWVSALADLDGDGRVDFMGASDDYGIIVSQNHATPGSVTSAAFTTTRWQTRPMGAFDQTTTVASGDLDGDGRPEIIAGDFWGDITILKNTPLVRPTTIVSVSPAKGNMDATVTITGTQFNSNADSNIVYFGSVKAAVSTASDTSLTVSVPTGITYDKVTVNNRALSLTASAPYPFLPTFDTTGLIHGVINFDPPGYAPSAGWSANPTSAIGDIDGDGKPDLVIAKEYEVYVYRNISTSGALTSSSFEDGVGFAVSYSFTGLDAKVYLEDIDGDGKLDIVNSAGVILRNTATSGSISSSSFAAAENVSATSYLVGGVSDMDNDGKADLVINQGSAFLIARNLSTPGHLYFSLAPATTSVVDGYYNGCGIADIDRDGKQDIITSFSTYDGSYSLSVFKNISVIGNTVFSPPVNYPAPALASVINVADIDDDGKTDVICRNTSGVNYFGFRNTSVAGVIDTASLASSGYYYFPGTTVCFADLDGDGKVDVSTPGNDEAYLYTGVYLYRNISTPGTVGAEAFADSVFWVTSASYDYYSHIAAGDLDCDGKADLLLVNYSGGATTLLRNNPLAYIAGPNSMCLGTTTTFTDPTVGGTWSISDSAVATIDTSGTVTALTVGTTTVTYSFASGGEVTKTVTVFAVPATITGTSTVCVGSAITLTNSTPGGSWLSSSTNVSVGSSTGIVAGVSSGTAIVSYYFGEGCGTTHVVSINALPSAGSLAGALSVCVSNTTTLNSTVSGGSWISGNSSVASVSSTGVVSGATAGTANITYSVTNSCGTGTVSATVTVNPLPNAGVITGTSSICVGGIVTLSASAGGGSWISNSPSVATVTAGGVVSGIAAGSALISYVITNSCGTSAATKLINVNAIPTAGTITGSSAVCVSGTTTLSNAISGGSWTASNGNATVSSTGVVTGVAAGNAVISYSVSNSCSTAVATKTMTVNALPNAGSITGSSSVATGGTITLSNSISGGTWTTSSGNATVSSTGVVTGVSAGSVTISYIVSNSCGTSYATKPITVISPVDSITGVTNVCIGNVTTLYSATSGGTWSASNTKATVGLTTGIVTGVAGGTVTITYSVAGNTATTIVTVNTAPAAITGASAICAGTTMSLYSATTGGAWSSLTTSVATINSAGVVSGISTGTSLISYTLPTGCAASAIVTVNPSPASITGVFNVCVGATVSLSNAVTGGTWGSSAPTVANVAATGVVTGMAGGTATITYTMTGGCKVYAVVTVYANPAAIGGSTTSMCAGASITLTETTTGGSWSSGNNTIATVGSTGIVAGLVAGTTYISYTMPAGCYTVKVVTVKPNPADITGMMSLCAGATTSLTSATGGGVSWVSGDNTVATVNTSSGVVTGVGAGTAAITYTIGNGCKTAAVVTVNPQPSVISGTAIMCAGATATLTNTTGGGSWISGNTTVATIGGGTGVINGLIAGTSIITYVLPTGCSKTAIVTVNANPASITGTAAVCIGSTTTLTNTTSGGTWSSGTTAVGTIGVSTGMLTGVTAGNTVITYKLSTGCQSIAVATVNTLTTAIGGTLSICPGNTTSLTNATTGGTWVSASPTVASIGSTSGVVTGVNPGTTTITYTAGCKTTAVVTVNALPAVITGTMSACAGATTSLTSATTGGSWNSSDALVASIDATTGIVTGIAAGTATISYSLGAGCARSAVVTIHPTPAAITGSTNLCAGSVSTLMSATPGGTWYSSLTGVAAVGGTTGIVTAGSAGVAIISYTLGAGCQVTAPVTVNVLPGDVTGTKTACVDGTTTLSSTTTGGSWSSMNSTVSTIDVSTGIVTGINTGTALISYTLTTGCAKTAIVTINALPATISGAGAICAGSSISLTDATAGGTWSSSDATIASVNTTGVVTGNSAGVATITYTIGTGCKITATVIVNQLPSAIVGMTTLCEGATTSLTNTVPGGTWNSSNTTVADIGSTGVVAGLTPGTSIITYELPTGCSKTTIVTVNALPAAISGAGSICSGSSATFTNTTSGGTWSSSDVTIASANTSSGIVTGNAAGVATISYTTGGGCTSTMTVSILAAPATIGGTRTICTGSTTSLTNATSGGVWNSGDMTKATVDASTGIVTGVAAGTAAISYNAGGGCYAIAVVTVNAMPSISGTQTVCVNLTTTLSGTPSGGAWSTASSLVTVNATTGAVTAGSTAGMAVVSYTSAGCTATAVVTVASTPSAIVGASAICRDQTTTFTNTVPGGTWISNNTTAATVDAATGAVTGMTAGMSSVISYTFGGSCWTVKGITVNATPAATTGYQTACAGLTTQFINAAGGVWTSSDTLAAKVNVGSGIITGVAAGTANITYSKSGCFVTRVVTVIATPGTITGQQLICTSLQTTLSDAVPGGTWSSSNTAIANVGSTTGIVTAGTLANVATISYNFGANCRTTAIVTVKAIPNVISGPATMCVTVNTVYTSSTTGGTWSSSNSGIANVVSGSATTSATFSGVTTGVATISYTNAPSCTRTLVVTVNACGRAAGGTTGIQKSFAEGMNISVYPNPTKGKFTFETSEAGKLFIYTLEGKQIAGYEITDTRTLLDLSKVLSVGVYMCRFSGVGGTTAMVRLVIE